MITPVIAQEVSENAILEYYEAIIARGLETFIDVGNALLAIRDKRLYREKHSTFEDYCQDRWGMQRAHAYRLMDAAKVAGYLSPMGDILPASERQARPLSSLEPEQQQEIWTQVVENAPKDGEGKPRITAALVQDAVNEYQGKPHVSHNSGNNEWYTPPKFIEAARAVMGAIDVDPASTTAANGTVRATTFYTIETDGLAQEWNGRVWMNPPYGQPYIEHFCDKLIVEYNEGRAREACVLVNNATETAWFQTLLLCADALCFPRQRVRFLDEDGRPTGQPLQGQAILYFGPHIAAFAEQFAEFGKILYATGYH
jgi:hypothetical protein